MILTIHRHVISRIPRYSVSYDNSNTWTLHVSQTHQDDRGYYMCQVNTNPMISQVGYLQVVGKSCFKIVKRSLEKASFVFERLLWIKWRIKNHYWFIDRSFESLRLFNYFIFAVPPNIIDSESTPSSVAVRENQNINISCKAEGFPIPKIIWRREDGQAISFDRKKKGIFWYKYLAACIFKQFSIVCFSNNLIYIS